MNLWSSFLSKLPSVRYTRTKEGKHLYKLTDRPVDKYLGDVHQAFTNGYADHNMINIVTSIPEVFAPIHAIAKRAANATFQLCRLDTDEVVYDNKKWNQLSEEPNFRQSLSMLCYLYVFYKYACGNRYIFARCPDILSRNFDNVVSIQLLPPQNTEPHIKVDRPKIWYATSMQDIIDYYQITATNDSDNIKSDAVVYKPFLEFGVNSINPVKGVTPLIAAEKPISNLIGVYAARNVIYFKRGALGFIVSKKQDESGSLSLTAAEKETLRNEMQDTYGVTGGKKSVVGLSDADIDFVRIAMSIEELKPFEETLADAEAIYAILGVPKTFIPNKDNGTFNNTNSDEKKLYQDISIDEGNEFARDLGIAIMLKERGYWIKADYSTIPVLQDDKNTTATTDKLVMDVAMAKYEKNFITKNQALVMMGLEEEPGGDAYASELRNDPWASRNEVGKLTALTGLAMSGLPPVVIKNQLIIVYGFSEQEANKLVEGLTEKTVTTNETPTSKSGGTA